MAKGFFDIKAWQKADDLAVDVYETTKSFPRHQLYSLTIILPKNWTAC